MGDYRFLARAVAGRRILLGHAKGALSYSVGDVIYVGDRSEPSEARETVTVQAAMVAAGSLDRAVMPRLLRARRNAVERYLTLEAIRACDRLRDVLPRSIVDSVERVCEGPISCSTRESMERATGKERIPPPPDWFGAIRPMKVLRAGPGSNGQLPGEDDRRGLGRQLDVPELGDDEEDSAERSKILELFSAPIGNNVLSAAFMRMLGMGRTQSGGTGGGELPVGGHRVGPVGSNAKRMPGASRMAAVATTGLGTTDTWYPEWNWQKREYRDEWCGVSELDPASAADNATVVPAVDPKLRSELARLGLTFERHRRQHDGDELDLSALVDFRIAVVSRGICEPHVYENRRHTGRDLGVLILLDATGSTGEEADGRAVFEDQRWLAWQLTTVLDKLGDRVATYAFYSRGREHTCFLRVKDYDHSFDRAAQHRLFSLKPSGFTRLGAALRHGTELLISCAGTSKLLLVFVGDGFPYDEGYEGRYACEDSRRALAEARARGVGCVGIDVGSAADEEVFSEVWADSVQCTLRKPDDLAPNVRRLFKTALRQARFADQCGGTKLRPRRGLAS